MWKRYSRLTYSLVVYFCWNKLFLKTGVEQVETNLEAQKVIVSANESVTAELMLEKLQKVRIFFMDAFKTISYFWPQALFLIRFVGLPKHFCLFGNTCPVRFALAPPVVGKCCWKDCRSCIRYIIYLTYEIDAEKLHLDVALRIEKKISDL